MRCCCVKVKVVAIVVAEQDKFHRSAPNPGSAAAKFGIAVGPMQPALRILLQRSLPQVMPQGIADAQLLTPSGGAFRAIA